MFHIQAQNPLPKYRGRKSDKIVQAGKIAWKQKSGRPVWTGPPLFVSVYRNRCNYSAVIAPVGQAPSQAPQSMQASAFTTATPPSMVTAPTGQAPSQAPQPTHASETLCAIIVLSLSPVRSVMKKPALARRVAGSLGNLILDTILAKQNQKGKTNRTAQNAKLVFLLGCTKAQANFWRKLKRFFGENHEI